MLHNSILLTFCRKYSPLGKPYISLNYNSIEIPVKEFIMPDKYIELKGYSGLLFKYLNDNIDDFPCIKYGIANKESREKIILVFLNDMVLTEHHKIVIKYRENDLLSLTIVSEK